MPSVLALRHIAYEDLDGFAPAFRKRGFKIAYRDAWFDDRPFDPLEPDVLVVLGAPVGLYEADDYPFIEQELDAVRARIEHQRPVLGVCFGAQMLAAALGARVYKGSSFEFGWGPLSLTEAGRVSPVAHYDGLQRAAFHCHGDTFDLPRGATLLASTARYTNQAFSMGPHLAMQFHGEVTERGLRRWYIGHAGRIRTTLGLNELRRQTEREAPKLEKSLNRVICAWLDSHTSARGDSTDVTGRERHDFITAGVAR